MTDPVDVVARTLDGEAEGCGALGMQAVANVIANRVKHPRWWGNTFLGVCMAPYQFSCWLPGPDRVRIEALTADGNHWFQTAQALAKAAIAGTLPDITSGADSYFAIGSEVPHWAARATPVYSDKWHHFYRLELAAPSGEPEAANGSVHAVPA